ncbi:hypothetical protein [Treponema putidum]|uniref:Uncharacterized protein n=1 Tax=Treponema putidum TaxID=221027 RepID=A0AAE9MS36_9SPIR|nr:hypothetical protein [Treponema putidum]AIN94168.1 hypothetical protein JO40_08675 [Treponema putidum]TWI79631.1 hypothetical protein JM98_00061 [Treponema putidum]UTY28117.1 hypothetical protein E4N76_03330 [Treponema putidum]UTY30613.1 hypothetical protein E4N75_02930 [Treponema putidum]UTY33024.1 hypothetical protein E4N74_02625 [Treponema putidum]
MKLKKARIILSFLFFFVIYPHIKAEGNESDFSTVLEEAEKYFSDIDWTESGSVLPYPMPEPFILDDVQTDNLSSYGDTDLQETLFPSLEGLGILDYTGIEKSVLNFLDNLSLQFKESKVDISLCSKEKPFLPYLINYRLDSFKPIVSSFYGRPENTADQKVKAMFRCNIRGNEKVFYRLFEITLIFMDEKWYIDSFDVIGDENEQASQ